MPVPTSVAHVNVSALFRPGALQSMGSQSSSGMSGGRGSTSGNPVDQSESEEQNQSSSSSSSSRQQGDTVSASEEDVDLAEVLAYLLRR